MGKLKMAFWICVVVLYFLPSLVWASEVVLKSGQKIEGKIIEQTNNYVKIDSGLGVAITYYMDQIDTIDGQKSASPSRPVDGKIQTPTKTNAEEMTVGGVLSNMIKALDSMKDYSCNFVVTSANDDGLMAQINRLSELTTGHALPKERVMQVWIKGNAMKTKTTYDESIVKKSPDGVWGTNWFPSKNVVQKMKLPDNAWPAWPHPLSIIDITKGLIDQNNSCKINEIKDGDIDAIVLSFYDEKSDRKDIYYIRKQDWMVYKSVVFSNGKIEQTSEWRDIKLDSGMDDNVFDLQIPDNAKVIS